MRLDVRSFKIWWIDWLEMFYVCNSGLVDVVLFLLEMGDETSFIIVGKTQGQEKEKNRYAS